LGYKFIHFEKPFNINFAQSYQILTQIAKLNAAVTPKFRSASRAFKALFLLLKIADQTARLSRRQNRNFKRRFIKF